jgi:hypothetical protein
MTDEQPSTPYNRGPRNQHYTRDGDPYTDTQEVAHAAIKGVTTWVLDNKTVVAIVTVLAVKNRRLKKDNAKLRKDLKKAGEALGMAADFIENASLFDRYFGARRGA